MKNTNSNTNTNTNTITNTKTFMLVVFAKSKDNKLNTTLVASIYYSNKKINFEQYNSYFELITDKDKKVMIQLENKYKTHIVRVFSTNSLSDSLKTYTDNYINFVEVEQNLDIKNLDKHYNNNVQNVKYTQYYNYFELLDLDFFSPFFITNYIFSKNINLLEHVFIFDTLN